MILNALGGPVKIEKFIPYTVVNAETGVVEYPEKSYFYEGIRIDPIPQSLLDEAYQRGYDSGYDAGYEVGVDEGKPYKYELEYIESSGTQYIDTGFKHNQNTRVVMDAQMLSSTTGNVYLFEGRNATGASGASKNVFFYGGSTGLWTSDYYGSGDRLSFSGIGATDRLSIDYNKNVCTINGKTVTHTAKTFQSNYSLYLLADNRAGSVTGQISAKLYSCQIYDNGTLVRDFIPVMDYAGTACLYDKVGKQLYYNKGTGSFNYAVKDGEGGVLLLLHGEEIKDSSPHNHAIANSGVSVSATRSKFGGKSLYFNGASRLEITSEKFLITNEDFTIDWWQYKENSGTFACLNPWSSGYSQLLMQHGGGNKLYSAYADNDGWGASAGATAFQQETGVWVHWAIIRHGTSLKTYRNGVQFWSGTLSKTYTNNSGGFLLGCHADSGNRDYFKGYVDELRISNVARWTSNFTPPTEAYSI